MKINLVTLCSGIEAQGQALRRLCHDYPELEWELLAWSEIDKDAIRAHNAIFPEYADRNLGDMTTADYSKITGPVDCLFYSTPCQSVSVAGQNKGMKEGTDAASALIWHTRRAIETLKPKVCILENVKGMIMGRNIKEFHKWQSVMESYGYTNFAKVLNSKDYGIPQNRERIFMLSIWGGQSYHFPAPFKLKKQIQDILEPYGIVDESFYFSAKQLAGMFKYCDKKKSEGCGFQTQFTDENGIASCVTTRYGASYTDAYLKEPTLQQRLSLYDNNAQAGRVYDVEGIAPCIDTCSGGNRMPKILTSVRTEEAKELRRKGIEMFKHMQLVPREDRVSNTITTFDKDNLLQEPCILGYTRDNKGKVCDRHDKDIANTIHTSTGNGGSSDQFVKEPMELSFDNLPNKTVLQDEDGKGYLWQDGSLWRVRKLIPMEVGRLMDCSDEDIQKMIDAGISKSALYSLFGNSICVGVLEKIFYKLFINTENENPQKSLFDF